MEVDVVRKIEDLCDDMYELFHDLHDKGKFNAFKAKMEAISRDLPESVSIAFNWEIQMVHETGEKSPLPFYEMGVMTDEDNQCVNYKGGSTLETYIIDEQMMKIPHDRCPSCWEVWAFKFKERQCPHCSVTLGKEVKILIDNDVCPWCEKGKVSLTHPTCDECGFEIDESDIIWG